MHLTPQEHHGEQSTGQEAKVIKLLLGFLLGLSNRTMEDSQHVPMYYSCITRQDQEPRMKTGRKDHFQSC